MKPSQAKRRAHKNKYKEQAARRKAEADRHPMQLELPITAPEPESEQKVRQAVIREKEEVGSKTFQVASIKSASGSKPAKWVNLFKLLKKSDNKKKSPVWVLYGVMLVTGMMTVWFSQDSINAYWQQTYHRASPLEKLNDYAWWRSGSRWQQSALHRHRTVLDWLDEQNTSWRQQHADNLPQAVVAPVTVPLPLATDSSPAPSQRELPLALQPLSDKVHLAAGDKVFFAGDSMMEGVAPHVQKWLSSQYGIESVNLSRQSTGLSYPSFFDWPHTIEKTLREDQAIKLLVVFLGPNDPWDFPNPQPGTRGYLKFQSPEWEQVYRQRIGRIVSASQEAKVQLIWMGVPLMKSNRLNAQMRYLDGLFASELAGKSIWLPTATLMGGEDGQYRDSITINGQVVRLRSKDGIHFTIRGQQLLADQIADRIDYRPVHSDVSVVPAAASEAVTASGES